MKLKKALATSFLAAVLIILVILAIMLMFNSRLNELYKSMLNKYTCKSSVRAQDFSTIKNIALPSDIKCPLQRIEIEEKNPEAIKQKFAKLYYDVCDEFGQGTLNLFGKRETIFCVVRDRIKFKEKGILIDNFGKYLAETKIPGKDISYLQFCSGYKTERIGQIYEDVKLEQVTEAPIDTSKEYVVIFVYAKGEEQLREFMKLVFGTSELHLASYIGAGVTIIGYGFTATGKGSLIGLPLVYLGKTMMVGGITTASYAGFFNWLTNKNIKMEWASLFLIREFDENELKKLPCVYLPAEQ